MCRARAVTRARKRRGLETKPVPGPLRIGSRRVGAESRRIAGCHLARPRDHRRDRGRPRVHRVIVYPSASSHFVNRSPSSATRSFAFSGESAGSTPRAWTLIALRAGTRALARAIELGPEGVIREVLASKLMGRGGAAFPTGRKWEAVAKAPARPHYVVCNADESEPGTFKDRVLLEGDPFAVIEGMTIAGFATGSERGYLYVRGEYPVATRRIERAILAARAAGLLGDNVMNSGVAFDLELRNGAGAYICGEETALFNSIEGKRGEPRNKPPFPVQAGLFGKPTVINNVETLVNIPLILARAARHIRSRHPGLDRAQAVLRFRETWRARAFTRSISAFRWAA